MDREKLMKAFLKLRKNKSGKKLTENYQEKLAKALAMAKKKKKKVKLGSKTAQRSKFGKKLGSSIAKFK